MYCISFFAFCALQDVLLSCQEFVFNACGLCQRCASIPFCHFKGFRILCQYTNRWFIVCIYTHTYIAVSIWYL